MPDPIRMKDGEGLLGKVEQLVSNMRPLLHNRGIHITMTILLELGLN